MKLVCSQTELNNALQLVSRAVSSRPTHPVLANLLLTADQGTNRISLTGFDLNLGIQTSFNASVERSGAITVPAKLFSEIVSKLSNDSSITLNSDIESQIIDLNSLNGNYQMRGMAADDFPDLPLVETDKSIKINAESFISALRSTLFASSSDDSKQILTGVHLSLDGDTLEAAATDGHRLAVLNLKEAINNNSNDEEIFSLTLPSRSLKEIERLLTYIPGNDPITLFCDKGQVVFLASDQIVTSRTLEGSYPNYIQLIPESFNKSIELNRKEFISALERVAVLADQHNNVIKIITDIPSSKIKISVDAQDVGTGLESLSADINGDSIQIAFNVKYILDGLRSIDCDLLTLFCNTPTTPAVISPKNKKNEFKYLIMPIQIRN